jgi:thiopurine S-methyltransferase
MEDDFWHKCWERNTLGFHQQQVHPFLAEHFKSRCLPDDKHVFVPLCGKTLDMAYLAQFIRVSGNELSEIACRDFFLDNAIEYQQRTLGDFNHYSCSQLSLLQGDFFKLSADTIGSVDWIYDRAALVALPIPIQLQYVAHLKAFFSAHTRLFLVTVEFPEKQLTGPPFAITANDVTKLFPGFKITCVASNELENKQFAQRRLDVDYLREKLYIISLAD